MTGTPLNPVEIERQLIDITNRISKGIQIFTQRYAEFLEKDREFDRAYAHAYLEADGSIKDKDMKAKLETVEVRAARDVAEVAYKQADKLLKARSEELRAMQSIGASVRQAYGVAGRGEF